MRANYAAPSLFRAPRRARARGRRAVERGMNEEEKRPERDGGSLHLREEEVAEQRRGRTDAN